MQARNVGFAYAAKAGDKPRNILSNVIMDVPRDARIGIIGINGAGKSTLLSILAGKAAPTTGEMFIHHNLRIGHFSQYQVDQLDMSLTPVAQ